jgi:hypothetical protein
LHPCFQQTVADASLSSYTILRIIGQRPIFKASLKEENMAEKSKQPKEPKKKPQKTMMEKRKEKRDKAATKHDE